MLILFMFRDVKIFYTYYLDGITCAAVDNGIVTASQVRQCWLFWLLTNSLTSTHSMLAILPVLLAYPFLQLLVLQFKWYDIVITGMEMYKLCFKIGSINWKRWIYFAWWRELELNPCYIHELGQTFFFFFFDIIEQTVLLELHCTNQSSLLLICIAETWCIFRFRPLLFFERI